MYVFRLLNGRGEGSELLDVRVSKSAGADLGPIMLIGDVEVSKRHSSENIMCKRTTIISGALFAAAHVIFYFWDIHTNSEGSWGGFLTFVIDSPASWALLVMANRFSLKTHTVLLVGGTAWWFSIGMLVPRLLGLTCRAAAPPCQPPQRADIKPTPTSETK